MNIRISEEIEVEVWQVERPPEIKPPKKDAFNLKFTKHIKTRSTSLNLFVESHHHLSINTDTLQIKSVAAYMKRYLCVCIPWLCFYVFVCAGVCFKARWKGNRKKRWGKKVTREKGLKTTRFVLISRNHTPAAAERDLWEHVCLISQPERPTKPKSDPNDVSSLGCFICWVLW